MIERESDISPEGSVSEVVTEAGHHHTDLVLLVRPARPGLYEVLHHLPGQVHHAQAVLPPGVLRGGVDEVSSAQLPQASQSEIFCSIVVIFLDISVLSHLSN